MIKQKEFKIKNRDGLNIVVLLEENQNAKGLVFIAHGLGGFKEQKHITTFAQAFLESGYTVVRYDATNSIGESGGKTEDATLTNHYQDLEDVIKWSKMQKWYQKPFCLAGHSLGSICILLYAEKHPAEVLALAPISTVVSGKLSLETHSKKELNEWKKTGWKVDESKSKPGVIKKLKWSHIKDRLKYDVLRDVAKLTMPVLLIVGDNDESTPVRHQRILFNALSGNKELHIIKGAPHTFRERRHLQEIKRILLQWIKLL